MEERSQPYVHAKWLAKLMAGDITCEWALWFKSRFKDWPKPPENSGLADWEINHTRLLRELRKEREALGEKVLLEGQSKFWWKRPDSALTVNGQPDLVTMAGNVVRVFDAKTGKARTADLIQVRLYMYFLREWVFPFRERTFEGMVVYPAQRTGVPWYSVDREFIDNVNYFLDILDTEEVPAKRPSFMECRFCDIAKDVCAERVEGAVADAVG
jgi:CRISPR/Cas system-associated exonuclease Cas4 (RecB family)